MSRFVAFLVITLGVLLSGSADQLRATEVVDKLNEYMDACVNVKKFNGSVLVSKGDEKLLSEGYGFANLEHDIANTSETKFRFGSITKQFTSMAVMLLHDRGARQRHRPALPRREFRGVPHVPGARRG